MTTIPLVYSVGIQHAEVSDSRRCCLFCSVWGHNGREQIRSSRYHAEIHFLSFRLQRH